MTGSIEDSIFSDEVEYGDGGNFATNKFRIGQNVKILNISTNQGYRELRGGRLKPLRREAGDETTTLTIEFNVDSWRFLKYKLNIQSETGSGGEYTHTLNIPEENFSGSSFAIQRRLPYGNYRKYYGVQPISGTITFQRQEGVAGALLVRLNCIVKKQEPITTGIETLSPSTKPLFNYYNTLLHLEDGDVVEVNSGTYDLNWNVNGEDSRFAYAELQRFTAKPIFTELSEGLTLNLTYKNNRFNDMYLSREKLNGANYLEFINDRNGHKVRFNFEEVICETDVDNTQFQQSFRTDVTFRPILDTVVVEDDIEEW